MGAITGANYNNFISTSEIYKDVRRTLNSFSSTNEIDEATFPEYTVAVLKDIAQSGLTEEDGFIVIENYKGCLPFNFKTLYAAYSCDAGYRSGTRNKVPHKNLQNVMWNETEVSTFSTNNKCEIECCESRNKLLERVVVKTYLGEDIDTCTYDNPVLLRLSPNVNRNRCAKDCQNFYSNSSHEISIDGNEIFTNFESGNIYMKYYGFPIDENGMPMIPEITKLDEAIKWYIIYETVFTWWLNNSSPDLQTKWQVAQQRYEKAMAEVRYQSKLPSFSTLVNAIRRQRTINKVSFFSSTDTKR